MDRKHISAIRAFFISLLIFTMICGAVGLAESRDTGEKFIPRFEGKVLIEDENGIEVGSAANEISFAIDGPGEIVEVRREGSCRLAVVRGKGGSGRAVELRASAKGLVSATVKFVSR